MASEIKKIKYGRTTIYVKKEFLIICSNPWDRSKEELIKFNIEKFLHREDGPAIVQTMSNVPDEYWLHGVYYLTEEEFIKAKHNVKFNNELEEIINESS